MMQSKQFITISLLSLVFYTIDAMNEYQPKTLSSDSQILINATLQNQLGELDQRLLPLMVYDAPLRLKKLISLNDSFYELFPKKVLLAGDPGTGKKTIALGIAAKYGFNIEIKDSNCLRENEITNLGRQFRSNYKPHVIVLHNINDDNAQAVINLISEIYTTRHKIIGTTNSLENLSEKFLEKFKTRFQIPLPSHESRKNIIRYYIEKNYLDSTPQMIKYIAKKTDSFKRADLELLVRNIAKFTNKRCGKLEIDEKSTISNDDFACALTMFKPMLKNPYSDYLTIIANEVKDKWPQLIMIAAQLIDYKLQSRRRHVVDVIDFETIQQTNGIIDKIYKCNIL